MNKLISLYEEISQQAFISSTCSQSTKIAFLDMKVPLQLADKFSCQSELLQCKDMSSTFLPKNPPLHERMCHCTGVC